MVDRIKAFLNILVICILDLIVSLWMIILICPSLLITIFFGDKVFYKCAKETYKVLGDISKK